MRAHRFAALTAILIGSACGGGGGGGGGVVNPPTTGSVRGTVVDQTAAPVPSAAVVLSATGQTARNATTGTTGVYNFANVPVGSWTATVTAPTGYTGTGTASVTVTGGQQANAAAITLNKTSTGGNPAPAQAAVSMANTQFNPQNVEVRVGGVVTWTNNDAVAHNATGGSGLATGDMNQGQSRSHTFTTAGTFAYSCTLHAGMSGQVTVR
jgi:plastocyanin